MKIKEEIKHIIVEKYAKFLMDKCRMQNGYLSFLYHIGERRRFM